MLSNSCIPVRLHGERSKLGDGGVYKYLRLHIAVPCINNIQVVAGIALVRSSVNIQGDYSSEHILAILTNISEERVSVRRSQWTMSVIQCRKNPLQASALAWLPR